MADKPTAAVLEPTMTETVERFGHHPDPAIDFCIEVEELENIVNDLELGLRRGEPLPVERWNKAMEFRVGGDVQAVNAKHALRQLQPRIQALTPPAGDDTWASSAFALLQDSARKLAPVCADLGRDAPKAGESDPLWWERQSALAEAGCVLGSIAALSRDEMREALERCELALPVLESMCRAASLPLGAVRAAEMLEHVRTALGNGCAQ